MCCVIGFRSLAADFRQENTAQTTPDYFVSLLVRMKASLKQLPSTLAFKQVYFIFMFTFIFAFVVQALKQQTCVTAFQQHLDDYFWK